MNKKETKIQNYVAIAMVCLCLGQVRLEAATIGIGTAFGTFLDIDGTALVEGGVSIGYFTVTLPTAATAANIKTFAEFKSTFGYQDVRSLLDSNGNPPTYTGSNTWDFASGWTGATLTVPSSPSNAPANAYNTADLLTTFTAGSTSGTALYALAFNKGNYANDFSGSTRWAVVTASAYGATANDWVYPTSSENVQLSQINSTGEVIIGTDGANVVGGNTSNIYLVDIVPEPSTGTLMIIGALGLMGMRRLRKL